MKAVVVYESLWGNTAAIAEGIAAGIGEGTRALSTAEATPDAIAGADLIVAGAPVSASACPPSRCARASAPGREGAQAAGPREPLDAQLDVVALRFGRAARSRRPSGGPGGRARRYCAGWREGLHRGGEGRAVRRHRPLRTAQGRRGRAGARVGGELAGGGLRPSDVQVVLVVDDEECAGSYSWVSSSRRASGARRSSRARPRASARASSRRRRARRCTRRHRWRS